MTFEGKSDKPKELTAADNAFLAELPETTYDNLPPYVQEWLSEERKAHAR